MMIVQSSGHPQPTGDAPMLSAMLGKRTVKDLHPSLQLPEAALHIAADPAHDPNTPGLLQEKQGALIPRRRLPPPPEASGRRPGPAPQSTIPADRS